MDENFLAHVTIFIHICTVCIALFFASVILTKKTHYRSSNFLLSALLICTALVFMYFVLRLAGFEQVIYFYRPLTFPVLLLFGPLIYCCVQYRLTPGPIQASVLVHFLPFAFLLVATLYFFVVHGNWASVRQVGYYVYDLSMPIYLLFTFKLLRTHRHEAFRGLKILMFGAILDYLLTMTILIADKILQWEIPPLVYINVSVPFALATFTFAYKGTVKSEMLFDIPKYHKSKLTSDKMKVYVEEMNRLMSRERLYLNADLKISDLATQLGVTSKYLSQSINSILDRNFYEYLSQYRVQHVKKLLEDPKANQYTLLALAEQAGFKSGSAFNAAFKRETGMLPSTYRRKTLKVGDNEIVA